MQASPSIFTFGRRLRTSFSTTSESQPFYSRNNRQASRYSPHGPGFPCRREFKLNVFLPFNADHGKMYHSFSGATYTAKKSISPRKYPTVRAAFPFPRYVCRATRTEYTFFRHNCDVDFTCTSHRTRALSTITSYRNPPPIRRRHHQPLLRSPRQKPRFRNIPCPLRRTSNSPWPPPRSARSTPSHLGPSRPDSSHTPSQKYKRRTPGTGQAPQNLFLLSNSSISSQPPILDNFWNFILSLEYRTYKQNPQKHPLTTFSKNEIFQPKPPNTANLCTPPAFANHALAPHANVARAPRPRG